MFELRKIGIVRRASAWLLDIILLAVLATGFMYLISLICHYSEQTDLLSQYYTAWEEFEDEHIETLALYYGFDYNAPQENGTFTITKDGAEIATETVIGELVADFSERYGFIYQEDNGTYSITKGGIAKSLDDVYEAFLADENPGPLSDEFIAYMTLPPIGKVNLQIRFVATLLFMMLSLGILFGYLILEFVIPLFLKDGQTVGKKVFGICLVRPDCVKIRTLALFARTLLGKYAIETMFPILLIFFFLFGGMGLLAVILLAAFLLLNIILFLATKNRTPIHDIFAGTVAVDAKLQMIYASEEELIEKKKAQHKEFLENPKY